MVGSGCGVEADFEADDVVGDAAGGRGDPDEAGDDVARLLVETPGRGGNRAHRVRTAGDGVRGGADEIGDGGQDAAAVR